MVDTDSPPTESVVTTSAVDQEAEDRAQIEEVWRSFWDLYQDINRIPESDRATLVDELAIDPIRTDVINKAAEFNVEGLDNYGSVVSHPYWSTPVAGQNIAQLGDCQDASQFGSLFVESGKKRTVGVVNNNMLGGFTRVGEGWKLHQIVYLRDVDCVP